MNTLKFCFCALGLFVFFCCGCSIFPSKNKEVRLDEANSKAKVVDGARLKSGGGLVVIPFRAGSGIGQTEELERVSLMFVKGFVEVISERNGPLRTISPQEASRADFILKGHVTKLKQTKGMKKWLSKAKDFEMMMEGEMVDQKTGQTVFVFSDKRKVTQENQDFKALAYTIGQDLARLVLDSINE